MVFFDQVNGIARLEVARDGAMSAEWNNARGVRWDFIGDALPNSAAVLSPVYVFIVSPGKHCGCDAARCTLLDVR